jgi:hypothetical protein
VRPLARDALRLIGTLGHNVSSSIVS